MIIGHYAVGFAATTLHPKLRLWQPMIAVGWMDVLHSALVIFGVERAAVDAHATAVVPMDLIYYPYSHSLLAAAGWSLLAYLLYRFAIGRDASSRERNLAALIMAACVFSHFVLDLIAHRADLPLFSGGPPKLGFGLWNHLVATFVVENAMLFGALAWFFSRFAATTRAERLALPLTAIIGSALFFAFPIAPFPPDVRWVEGFALLVYVLIPIVAFVAQPEPRAIWRTNR